MELSHQIINSEKQFRENDPLKAYAILREVIAGILEGVNNDYQQNLDGTSWDARVLHEGRKGNADKFVRLHHFLEQEEGPIPKSVRENLRDALRSSSWVLSSEPAMTPTQETYARDLNSAREALFWFLTWKRGGPYDPSSSFELSQAAEAIQEAEPEEEGDFGPERRKVFLCHAKEDRYKVMRLYNRLRRRGHKPWIDEHHIPPGADWAHAIEGAIEDCDVFLACLSSKSVTKRGYVQAELRKALDLLSLVPPGEVFLIPVLLEECDPPRALHRLQWLDLTKKDKYKDLYAALERRRNDTW